MAGRFLPMDRAFPGTIDPTVTPTTRQIGEPVLIREDHQGAPMLATPTIVRINEIMAENVSAVPNGSVTRIDEFSRRVASRSDGLELER